MLMKCMGSSSSGNGYALIVNDGILLIECGVPGKEMLRAIDYQTSKVSGCLLSHVHGDHANYIKDYMKYGIEVYCSDEVSSEVYTVYGEKTRQMQRMRQYQVGNFNVIAFSVPHNGTECDGFFIEHDEIGRMLFITDAEYCPYNFSKMGINHAMIECNYSKDYLTKDLENYGHVISGHMELETCKRLIQTINTPMLRSVGLMHLSAGNGNPTRFRKEVIELLDVDVEVYVAEKYLEKELWLEPF